MPRKKLTFVTVRKLGLALPEVEESTSFRQPALKVRGKMMACVPSHKSAEPDSLVVRINFEDRDERIAAAPETYYLTDHYVGYSAVLVRLSHIDAGALQDLLKGAHRFVTSGEKQRV